MCLTFVCLFPQVSANRPARNSWAGCVLSRRHRARVSDGVHHPGDEFAKAYYFHSQYINFYDLFVLQNFLEFELHNTLDWQGHRIISVSKSFYRWKKNFKSFLIGTMSDPMGTLTIGIDNVSVPSVVEYPWLYKTAFKVT